MLFFPPHFVSLVSETLDGIKVRRIIKLNVQNACVFGVLKGDAFGFMARHRFLLTSS